MFSGGSATWPSRGSVGKKQDFQAMNQERSVLTIHLCDVLCCVYRGCAGSAASWLCERFTCRYGLTASSCAIVSWSGMVTHHPLGNRSRARCLPTTACRDRHHPAPGGWAGWCSAALPPRSSRPTRHPAVGGAPSPRRRRRRCHPASCSGARARRRVPRCRLTAQRVVSQPACFQHAILRLWWRW